MVFCELYYIVEIGMTLGLLGISAPTPSGVTAAYNKVIFMFHICKKCLAYTGTQYLLSDIMTQFLFTLLLQGLNALCWWIRSAHMVLIRIPLLCGRVTVVVHNFSGTQQVLNAHETDQYSKKTYFI